MSDGKRIKRAINWLISQGRFSSQKEIGEKIGITNRSYLSQLVNSDVPPVEFVNKFTTLAPEISASWLLYNEGEMLKSENDNARLVGTAAKVISENTAAVRFFEVTPTASFQEFCTGATETPTTINIMPDSDEQLDESFCVFEVSGESMAPQIQPHARVLCKEMIPSRWHTLNNAIVVIAYSDRFVIKRIVSNNLKDGNSIILGSDNTAYPDKETVQLADIRAIFQAKRIISQNIF